jgi:hypothetical protein
MGVSVRSDFFYGYRIPTDHPLNQILMRCDWENTLRISQGLLQPTSPDYKGPEWAAWRKETERTDTVKEIHFGFSEGDGLSLALAIKASHRTAYCSRPIQITDLTIDPSWLPTLQNACQVLGVTLDGLELGWWITTYYSH